MFYYYGTMSFDKIIIFCFLFFQAIGNTSLKSRKSLPFKTLCTKEKKITFLLKKNIRNSSIQSFPFWNFISKELSKRVRNNSTNSTVTVCTLNSLPRNKQAFSTKILEECLPDVNFWTSTLTSCHSPRLFLYFLCLLNLKTIIIHDHSLGKINVNIPCL